MEEFLASGASEGNCKFSPRRNNDGDCECAGDKPTFAGIVGKMHIHFSIFFFKSLFFPGVDLFRPFWPPGITTARDCLWREEFEFSILTT